MWQYDVLPVLLLNLGQNKLCNPFTETEFQEKNHYTNQLQLSINLVKRTPQFFIQFGPILLV